MILPILSSQFFEMHSPDLGFFSKWSALHPWNERIVPIYEWQDILYVGCLQPPKTFPQTSHKVVFLLCEPEALRRVWYSFEGTVVSNPQPTQIPQAGVTVASGISLETDTPSQDLNDFKLEIDSTALADAPVFEEDSSLELPTLNAGADEVAPELETLQLDEFTPPPASVAEVSQPKLSLNLETSTEVADQPLSVLDEAPESLDLKTVSRPDDSPTSILEDGPGDEELAASASASEAVSEHSGLLDLSGGTGPDSALTKTSTSPLVSLKPASIVESAPTSAELVAAGTSTSTAVAAASQPISDEKTPVAGIVAETENKRATPVKSEAVPFNPDVTRVSIQALNSVPVEKMDSWVEKLFSEMNGHYSKTMILLKSGDQVKPWKWNTSFTPSTPAVSSISLVQPSPFRIVHRSHKPFHGYVVPNELNDKFFAQWNGSVTPEHLTITPIMIEDHVIGMLLAIGNKEADTKSNLQLSESLASSIAKKIKAQSKAA